ncbi:FecR family protein [Macellibacteroides fermentans]|uniref:Ferric-dicitrate binding protein FerR (Iron transport regulator) n=1 Tax=Macellibacteroides fermentans TaxID=879969 RepID=A0A8E2A8J1_9PORP|nr:FecR domain-containing protein [Macellibacteroides fermentans]NYI50861.1 ferric-dicitrate binding protein FerR (iron transport regulator) [Macellibacteroides fermentans]
MTVNKIYIKKILNNSMNETEKEKLHSGKLFSNVLEKQWEDAQDATAKDKTDMNRIWAKIQKELWESKQAKTYEYYKIYSIAASILLLIGIGCFAWILSRDQSSNTMFVATSGIQNMQSILLPDGSQVQLGPGSKLVYPSEFDGKTREVKLEGQAFFDVAKDKSKPFVVKTKDMDVTALGTAFEVFSYEMENSIETVLLNGKVKVDLLHGNHKREVILNPNDKLTLSRSDARISIEKVNATKYSDWRNLGILSFENEKLSMIIPRLEKWYGQKIFCQKDLANTYRFTFKVRNESLDRILYMLNNSSPIKYRKAGDNYELYLIN